MVDDGVLAPPFEAGELGVGLDRAGFIGGDGVAVMTGIWTHFGHNTSLPVKVTRSPDGNGCLCKTTPGKSKNKHGVISKMIHSKTLEIIDISKKKKSFQIKNRILSLPLSSLLSGEPAASATHLNFHRT